MRCAKATAGRVRACAPAFTLLMLMSTSCGGHDLDSTTVFSTSTDTSTSTPTSSGRAQPPHVLKGSNAKTAAWANAMIRAAHQPQPPLRVAVAIALPHVDFNHCSSPAPYAMHRAGGVLMGGGGGVLPPIALLQPLEVGMVRSFLPPSEFLTAYRVLRAQHKPPTEVQWILSNAWAFAHNTTNVTNTSLPGADGNWTPWREFVDTAVRTLETARVDRNVLLLDVWNEPNFFDDDDWLVFLEAWRVAHEVVAGRYRLVGPSTASAYYKGRLQSFLEFVSANKCAPSVVSWHELGDTSGRLIPVKVSQFRAMMKNFSILADISINEIVPSTHMLYPGSTLSYLAGIEAADVRSAAHSCWGDCNGYFNCPLSHLDGLLSCPQTPGRDGPHRDLQGPRPAWWVYAWYAALTGGRIANVTTNVSSPYSSADAMAVLHESQGCTSTRAEIVVGYFGFPGDFAAVGGSVIVSGIAAGLVVSDSVHLLVERAGFNRTGDPGAPLDVPMILFNGSWPVGADGAVVLDINETWDVRVQDAIHVVITKPD